MEESTGNGRRQHRAGSGPREPARAQPFRTLRDYLMVIRERWLLGLTVALALATLFTFLKLRQTPVYVSTASLLIEVNPEKVLNIETVVDTSLGRNFDAALNRHLVKLNSRSFLERTLESFTENERQRIVAPYRQPGERPPSVGSIVGSGRNVQRNGQVFGLTFRHRDPKVAAMLANRYTTSYIDAVLERSGTSNASAHRFLQDRVKELQRKVGDGERALQRYRQKHNLVSLEDNQNIIVARLNNLNNSLTGARVERLGADAKVAQVEAALEKGNGLLDIPVIAQFGSIQQFVSAIDTARSQRAELAPSSLSDFVRSLLAEKRPAIFVAKALAKR